MTEAEALLADQYEGAKAEVLRTVAAKLGGSGSPFSGSDLDPAYNEAWHALYLRLEEGEDVANHLGFLVTVTYRRALSEQRARRLERVSGEDELAGVGVEPDVDARLDAEMQLRQFVQGLRDRLSGRELAAATLCHLHGLSRPEAAEVIGIAPRRMEKLMDGASKQIRAVIGEVKPGELCSRFDSLVRAFAVGLLDEGGERYQLARDHLADCPACRRKVLVLRGLGAIAPPDPGLLALVAGTVGIGAGGVAVGGGKEVAATGPVGTGAATAGGLARKGALVARKGVLAAGATAAVAAVAVVAVALSSGDGDPAPAPPAASVAGATAGAEAEAARAAAKQARLQAAQARAAAERERARQRARAQQRLAAESEAAAVRAPAPAPEPAPESEPVAPAPEPAPAPTPEPAPEPQAPIKDAAVEFELR